MKYGMIADFTDRTIVLTGASGFLGRAFAKRIAKLGASCILIDQNLIALKQMADRLSKISSAKHHCFQVDFTNSKNIETAIAQITETHNCIDTLINNAAFTGDSTIEGWGTDFPNQSLRAWHLALQVNLTSCFTMAQKLMPLMKSSDNASIINIGSIYAKLAPDYSIYEGTNMHNPAAYGASKAGLIHLTKWLAATLGPEIRVNAISPGGIYRQQDEQFVRRYTHKTVLKRMATEEDIVPAMIFLASDNARYITGQNLVIDGGYSIL
tara:strand:- start:5305 stop:6105 length:801 start_codon:yes stop_codon:yes gene_type:complete